MLLRADLLTSGEAPSRSFGEASPNDIEGASEAFVGLTAENWCASDHESPSCAFGAEVSARGREGGEGAFPAKSARGSKLAVFEKNNNKQQQH